jgi:hypothetical protein
MTRRIEGIFYFVKLEKQNIPLSDPPIRIAFGWRVSLSSRQRPGAPTLHQPSLGIGRFNR